MKEPKAFHLTEFETNGFEFPSRNLARQELNPFFMTFSNLNALGSPMHFCIIFSWSASIYVCVLKPTKEIFTVTDNYDEQ